MDDNHLGQKVDVFMLVANTVGLIASTFSIAIYFFIAYKDSKLVNRITLRLQAALSIADWFMHMRLYLDQGSYANGVCQFLGFCTIYLSYVYICITISIIFVLHSNILLKGYINEYNEKYLWYFILVLPFIANIPLYALGIFGKDPNAICFIKSEYSMLSLTNIFGPLCLTFMYSLIIIILIINNINKDDQLLNRVLEGYGVSDTESKTILRNLLNNWISRLIMYPVSFCLVHFGLLLDISSQAIFNHFSPFLFYWGASGVYLSGLINLIAFLCDPYYQGAINILLFRTQREAQPPELKNSVRMDKIYSLEIEMNFLDSEISKSCKNTTALKRYNPINTEEAESLLRQCTSSF